MDLQLKGKTALVFGGTRGPGWAGSIPKQRFGTAAADGGARRTCLASPRAGYITGQNICVDGGLTRSVT